MKYKKSKNDIVNEYIAPEEAQAAITGCLNSGGEATIAWAATQRSSPYLFSCKHYKE